MNRLLSGKTIVYNFSAIADAIFNSLIAPSDYDATVFRREKELSFEKLKPAIFFKLSLQNDTSI